jgi:hypothetical protein
VSLEGVCCLAGDANFVLAAWLEAGRFLCDVIEEPEAFFFWGGLVLNHASEGVYFAGDGGERGGQDGIKLAQVGKGARKVEGQGVESVGVL